MKVTYIGPSRTGVEIAATGQVVEHGGTVEVGDDLGRALCEQVDNWQPVKAAKTKAEEV